jgi:hypothetical protein
MRPVEESIMKNACTYHQHCPVCGRSLHVNVTLLGQTVYCQHCGGGFVACDPCNARRVSNSREERVDELLERASLLLSAGDHTGS